MTYSNLSKIRPKLRTTGNVTGNFGRPKTRTNGNSELGLTTKENISVTRKSDYINRMYQVLDTTTDRKIQQFAYDEIRKYLIQTNQW
jgi:hypothetical protein